MNRPGYLLIEMIIALAIVVITTIAIARIEAVIMQSHVQAYRIINAVNVAQNVLARLQDGDEIERITHEFDEFEVAIDSYKPDQSIPFIGHQVTVSFEAPAGTRKIIIEGGTFDRET